MESSASQPKIEQRLWTSDEIQTMLDTEVKYKDWKFVVSKRDVFVQGSWDVDLRLRIEWWAPDALTGEAALQQSRWWPLSKHMVKSEIIQTAFLAVLKAEEHEIRETFQYFHKDLAATGGGWWAAPFNSHIDIEVLSAHADEVDVRVDTRPEAPKNQRRE
jgi:hypothetical protein